MICLKFQCSTKLLNFLMRTLNLLPYLLFISKLEMTNFSFLYHRKLIIGIFWNWACMYECTRLPLILRNLIWTNSSWFWDFAINLRKRTITMKKFIYVFIVQNLFPQNVWLFFWCILMLIKRHLKAPLFSLTIRRSPDNFFFLNFQNFYWLKVDCMHLNIKCQT